MSIQPKILITGANGQLGTVLTKALRDVYGVDQVLATDIQKINDHDGHYEFLDILNVQRFKEIIQDHHITQVYHLAAILSANGEWNPIKTWNINLNGYLSLLELSRECGIEKVFFPSTIAVFGHTTPKDNTPQDVPLLPTTVYGISKSTGELLSNYYHMKYGLDVRSVRYPGIIGWQSIPAGGTTDYAVEMFYAAIKGEHYTCFLDKNTRLPMMYMDDAVQATIQLMSASKETLSVRHSYNLAAISFTPEELYTVIKQEYPQFTIDYKPDFRQQIAASWSSTIDDSLARKDWHWQHAFDLEALAKDMIHHLKKQINSKE